MISACAILSDQAGIYDFEKRNHSCLAHHSALIFLKHLLACSKKKNLRGFPFSREGPGNTKVLKSSLLPRWQGAVWLNKINKHFPPLQPWGLTRGISTWKALEVPKEDIQLHLFWCSLSVLDQGVLNSATPNKCLIELVFFEKFWLREEGKIYCMALYRNI